MNDRVDDKPKDIDPSKISSLSTSPDLVNQTTQFSLKKLEDKLADIIKQLPKDSVEVKFKLQEVVETMMKQENLESVEKNKHDNDIAIVMNAIKADANQHQGQQPSEQHSAGTTKN